MRPIYRDLWIRIGGSMLAAHFIDSLGRPESFFEQLTKSSYYIDLFFGSAIAFSLWTMCRTFIVFLDKRYPWHEQAPLRIALQAILAFALPLVASFLLTFLFMRFVWQQDIFRTEFMYSEFPVVALVILLINFGYFTYWLYYNWQLGTQPHLPAVAATAPAEQPAPEASEKKSGFIEVTKAGKTILLRNDELAYAYLSDGYCYLRTHGSEVFVTTFALDDLFALLEEDQFFRVNRQMIVNRSACQAYRSIEFGKIALDLEPAFREPVIVSQKRAKTFREWISVVAG